MEQQSKDKSKKSKKARSGQAQNTIAVKRKGPTEIQISGNGRYSIKDIVHATLSGIPKGTFASMGGALGSALGGPGGGMIGGAMGKGLSMLTGYGEYILNDIVHRSGAPAVADPNTARRIVHSEFITDLASPSVPANFTVGQTFYVNPGDSTCFPWLAPIAQRFAKYKFQQLVFEFRSTTSEYSTNSAMGSVVVAPNYNPIAPAPLSKPQMEAMTGAVSSKPSNSLLAGVECASRNGGNPERWVRNPSVNTPTQLTDLCDFYVASSGLAASAGTVLGELWVHYTVDLFEPYLPPSGASDVPGGSVVLVNTAGSNVASCFGNIGVSGTSFVDNFGLTGFAARCFTRYVGAPPDSQPYVLSVDAGTPGRLWFGRAGKYILRTTVRTGTAFTSQTGACWTYLFSDVNATLSKPSGSSESGSTQQVFAEHWITVPAAGTSLTYTYNAVGWGTAPNTNTVTTLFEVVQ